MNALDVWTGNLVDAYGHLPPDALEKIRDSLDLTLNRAAGSLNAVLEKDHKVLERINSMISLENKCLPDDFQKKKWFQK